MKSKKPFLIVCAAALTLAVAFPFMGVFAFAEDDSYLLTVRNAFSQSLDVTFSFDGVDQPSLIIGANGSRSISIPLGVSVSVSALTEDTVRYAIPRYHEGVNLYRLSSDSSDPTVFPFGSYPDDVYFNSNGQESSPIYGYFSLEPPPVPPDPLAPVSDGMDTMISVFGDVIDYIINTPDVAIFVAISVASCAIIPMGIILIKKLIKGY